MRKSEKALAAEYRKLKSITPKQWLETIRRSCPTDVIPGVARIVWWDFFSDRTLANRASEFDPFLKFVEDQPSADAVYKCLLAIGYPKHRAQLRVKSAKEAEIAEAKKAEAKALA